MSPVSEQTSGAQSGRGEGGPPPSPLLHGPDVRVAAVEQQYLAALRTSGRLLVLVNELGRVVVSTSSRMLSGDLVEAVDVPALLDAGDRRLTRIAGSELALLDLGAR